TSTADTFTVTGSSVAVGGQTVNYTAEALSVLGREGDDTFNVTSSATVPIFLDGGDPIGQTPGDQINLAASGAVTFEAGPESDEGRLVDGTNEPISFDRIEGATVSGGSGSITISGTNGADSITVIARDNSTHAGTDGVQDFTVSVNAGGEVLFIDQSALTINAGSGSDEITLRTPAPNDAEWDVDVTINGGPPSASDRLVIETPGQDTVVYTPGTTPDSGTLLIDEPTNDSTITINQIEELVYDGEAGGDSLTVNFSGLLVYQPDLVAPDAGRFTANSSLPVQFVNLGAGVLAVSSQSSGDTFVVAGTEYADPFQLDGSSVQFRDSLPVNHNLAADDVLVIAGGGPSAGSDTVTVTGSAGDDTISLDLSADTLTGVGPVLVLQGVEELTVQGGGGNDSMSVTELGAVSGLDRVDLAFAGSSTLTVTGTAGDERIEVQPTGAGAGTLAEASEGPQLTYSGFGGPFTVDGGGGTDVLAVLGTDAADTVTTPSATSVTISGGTVAFGPDVERLDILTGAGDDRITISNGMAIPKVIDAGAGDDVVDASAAAATDPTIYGGAGDDSIVGSPGPDLIFGGAGNDTISGLAGADTIYGEAGDDQITGGTGGDALFGGDDADTFVWTAGDGSDLVEGGTGADVLDYTATAGADTIALSANGTRVNVADGTDIVDVGAVEEFNVDAGAGADSLAVEDLSQTDATVVSLELGAVGDTDQVRIEGRIEMPGIYFARPDETP
ncbi:MAG TPA: calcium-binding protein, partial [Planctomycetaceae bacterium]|nr:calcium-binding protein [Planctomycetaceae bacterium]